MGLRLFFLPNFLGATFVQGATFIPDSRVDVQYCILVNKFSDMKFMRFKLAISPKLKQNIAGSIKFFNLNSKF